MTCREIISSQCSKGHSRTRRCNQTDTGTCKKCEKERKDEKDRRQREFERQKQRDENEAEYLRLMLYQAEERLCKAERKVEKKRKEVERLGREIVHQQDAKRSKELRRQRKIQRLQGEEARREYEAELVARHEVEEKAHIDQAKVQQKPRDLGIFQAGFQWIKWMLS